MSELVAAVNLFSFGFAWGVLGGAVLTFKFIRWCQS